MRAAYFADARSESWAESRARAIAIEGGFEVPDLQVVFPDPMGRGKGIRVDMLFRASDGSPVAAEVDGMEKYVSEEMLAGRTTVEALVDERQRESRINALGIPVMRCRARDLYEPGRFERMLEMYGVARNGKAGDSARTIKRRVEALIREGCRGV